MSEQQAYLCVPVLVMVKVDPDWRETWPEDRCHQMALEVRDSVSNDYSVSNEEPKWWVQE